MVRTLRLCALLAVLALTAACKEEVYSGLTEREANEMIAALQEIGIPASKTKEGEGLSVSVDSGRFAEAVNHLNEQGLPSVNYETFGDVFRKEGIVSSPMEERARYIYALSQELSETIGGVDGVMSARVHVVLPETDMLGRDFQPSSASVFIRHAADAQVADVTPQIKNLVANSIEGLSYDNVTVVAIPVAARQASSETMPALQDVLGIWVHPASVGRLWTLVAIASGVALLSAGGAAAVVLRRRGKADPDAEFERA